LASANLDGYSNAGQNKNRVSIFISYRRTDVSHAVHRLCDWLKGKYGQEKVFIDVDDIPVGIDFVQHISKKVASSAVMIAVIGPNWGSHRYRRGFLHNFWKKTPPDFVQIEIELAQQFHVPIIPVLVDYAKIPSESDLPKSIKKIAYLNAIEWEKPNDLETIFAILTELVDGNFPK